ncbi:MAG: hypothetical protein K1X57_16170 [Gemmataceae bacterium]|nr:hypothetical protein [Gemmataceae bacterium]
MRPRKSALRLLSLESRDVPAAVAWDGGAGTNLWSDAANWDTNTLPAAGDDVTIGGAAQVVFSAAAPNVSLASVTSTAPFLLSGGVLDIATTGNFSGAFTQTGGTLQGTGAVSLSGGGNWSGGSWGGTGKNVVLGSTPLTIDTSGTIPLLGRNFDVSGNLIWTGNQGLATGNATLKVKSGGEFDVRVTGGSQWYWGTGSGPAAVSVESGGVLRRSVATDGMTFSVPIDNAGTVIVSSGTLLSYGGVSTGAFQLTGNYGFIAGVLSCNTGTTFTGTGTLQVSGELLANVDTTIACPIRLNGALSGKGAFTLAGGGVVSGGGWFGSGKVVIPSGTSLSINTASGVVLMEERRVENSGSVTWTGTLPIYATALGGPSSAWVNLAGSIFTASAAADWIADSGPTALPFINEAGAQFKYVAGGKLNFGGAITNAGTWSQVAGTVGLGSSFTNTGTASFINVATGGSLTHTAGSLTVGGLSSAGPLTLTGDSTFRLDSAGQSGRFTVGSGVTIGGNLSLNQVVTPNVGDTYTLIDNTSAGSVTGTFNGLAEGSTFTVGFIEYQISYAGGTGNDVTLLVTKASPPTTATVQVDSGTIQRSTVRSLTVNFSGPVTFPEGLAAAFQIARSGPGSPTGFVNLAFSQSGNQVTVTFNDATFAPGTAKSLIDGNYSLTLVASKILGAGGAALDGDGNGSPGGDGVTLFHRLFGDADGNKVVNSADFLQFRLAFLSSNPTFDADGDGQVTSSDFLAFRLNFLKTLP